MTISITGSGGVPPYSVLIIPFGGTPLPNNVEARTILSEKFDGSSTSISFKLNYPALSQFVAVVSDSTGFGSGGTSSAAIVATSDDSSCFDSTQNVQSKFFFNLDPLNQIVQCTQSRIWWDPNTVQGQPTFYGVIPGGKSFNITVGQTTPKDGEGVGFFWTPNVKGGTTLMLGAGDNRGLGAGGSVTYIVSAGNGNTGCLDSSAPSSTAGSPAGGNYPTSTSEAQNGNSSSSSNAGPIAGGVVAAVVVICAFILVLLFLRRRKQRDASAKERPDLFTDNENPVHDGEIAHLAPPEPYIVPSEPPQSEWGSSSRAPGSSYGYGVGTGAAGTGAAQPLFDHRMSGYSLSTGTEGEHLRPSTPQTATTSAGTSAGTSRKGAAPPVFRPVNIIQHEDAGTTVDGEDDAETVELPPAYTNIRR